MFTQTIVIDPAGRITLPQPVLEALGLRPEAEVLLELTETGVMLRPKHRSTPITDRIVAMNLPVAEWDQMEREVEAGRLESW